MTHFKTVARPNYKEISHGVLSCGDDWRIGQYNDTKYYFETRFDNDCGWVNRFWSYSLQDVLNYRDEYDNGFTYYGERGTTYV